jgi:perosamine synthetase
MDRVMEFARLHRLKVIEDCAHCVGGGYAGKKLGTWGDAGCFSFEEKKGMTTGDGGMLIAQDADLVERMRPHRWVGIDKDTWRRRESYTAAGVADSRHWHYEVSVLGHKYNMNDLAACIGRVQLRKLDRLNERKQVIIKRYLETIPKSAQPLLKYSFGEGAYWLFGIRTEQREAVIRHLKEQRIATGVHYMPLNLHPLFADYKYELPISSRIWETLVTLPLHPELEDEDVVRVARALSGVLADE